MRIYFSFQFWSLGDKRIRNKENDIPLVNKHMYNTPPRPKIISKTNWSPKRTMVSYLK